MTVGGARVYFDVIFDNYVSLWFSSSPWINLSWILHRKLAVCAFGDGPVRPCTKVNSDFRTLHGWYQWQLNEHLLRVTHPGWWVHQPIMHHTTIIRKIGWTNNRTTNDQNMCKHYIQLSNIYFWFKSFATLIFKLCFPFVQCCCVALENLNCVMLWKHKSYT